MVHPARPKYRDNADFLVRFEPADGPGFYPGAGGFFHGCTLPQEPRVVFYGTDFGTTCEAGAARAMGGEAKNQWTIKKLRELVEEVACDTGNEYAPVWSIALPELVGEGGEWRRATVCRILAGGAVRDAGAGRRVQVMYHPASRGDWDRCRAQARDTLAREVRRLAKSARGGAGDGGGG